MPKRKTTKKDRIEQANREHELWLASMGYKGGKSLRGKHGRRMGIYEIPDYNTGPRVTSDKVAGNGNRKDRKQYTGDYIKGIATMHKSNAVPITNSQQAIEVSQMRRS